MESETDAGSPNASTGEPPEAAAGAASGAPPSNTAPGNSKSEGAGGTKIVGAGIDSLYLSVRGDLKPGIQKILEVLKLNAQSLDPERRALAQFRKRSGIPSCNAAPSVSRLSAEFPGAREQVADLAVRGQRQALQNIAQVRIGIQAVETCRLDQTHHHSCAAACTVGASK
jgi:hypothetical protein